MKITLEGIDCYFDWETCLKEEAYLKYKDYVLLLICIYGCSEEEAIAIAQEKYPQFKPVYDPSKWKVK